MWMDFDDQVSRVCWHFKIEIYLEIWYKMEAIIYDVVIHNCPDDERITVCRESWQYGLILVLQNAILRWNEASSFLIWNGNNGNCPIDCTSDISRIDGADWIW
jgi:hypothetical protein